MRRGGALLLGLAGLALGQPAWAQNASVSLPKIVQAGDAFSVQSAGSGKGVLYIVGLGQVLKRDVQLGQMTPFPAGSLFNAGRYLVILVQGSSTTSGSLDVVPAHEPADLSFLARPSRLPVGLHDAISGTVYVFDAYRNLITTPTPVSFSLSNPSSSGQQRTLNTRHGSAWTEFDSTAKEGVDKFTARAGAVSSIRVVEQVPGDPCKLTLKARPEGQRLALETDPVRDCSGNAVPDGTIVTFTENYNDSQSTVDVPLKHGIARVEMPAHSGARVSVASGVVLGNEIRWER